MRRFVPLVLGFVVLMWMAIWWAGICGVVVVVLAEVAGDVDGGDGGCCCCCCCWLMRISRIICDTSRVIPVALWGEYISMGFTTTIVEDARGKRSTLTNNFSPPRPQCAPVLPLPSPPSIQPATRYPTKQSD